MSLEIDWGHLHQISDNNAAFERELLQIFVEDAQKHIEMAQAALLISDAEQLARIVHHIKGSSANVGLYGIQAIAATIEEQAQQRQLTQVPSLLDQLISKLEAVIQFLNDQR